MARLHKQCHHNALAARVPGEGLSRDSPEVSHASMRQASLPRPVAIAQPPVHGRSTDAERGRRLGRAPTGGTQGRLDLLVRKAPRAHRADGNPANILIAVSRRQHSRRLRIQHDRKERATQFTDVPLPTCMHQQVKKLRGDLWRIPGALEIPVMERNKASSNERNVLLSFTQWRESKPTGFDSRKKVLEKDAALHKYIEVNVACQYDPHVHGDVSSAPERSYDASFNREQKAGLDYGRGFADLIKKQRASICGDERPCSRLVRICECSTNMAEEI